MFVRGGSVYPGTNLNYAGDEGYYWSSVGRSSTSAYDLVFASGVGPSNYNGRGIGFPVRCVALGG